MMLEAIKYSSKGDKIGTVQLDDSVFLVNDTRPDDKRNALMYEVINMYLGNQRQGTVSVRSRSEVRGTTAKMLRQVGSGNARAGSRRSPIRVGGGVALGPRPKDWYKQIPKQKKRLALKYALTAKALSGNIFILESLNFDEPNTRTARSLIDVIIPEKGRILLVINDSDMNVIKSFTNIPNVEMDRADSLFAYEVLKSKYLILTEEALRSVIECFGAPKRETVANKS